MNHKEKETPLRRLEELERLAAAEGCEVRREEPMSRHTTFQIGGPADLFVTAPEEAALSRLLAAAAEREVPVLLLGNGSNLLVSDRGVPGLVVALGAGLRTVRREGNRLVAGAGAPLSAVCSFARREALSGVEFLWGVPGSVGGAVFMNAGAYGGEIGQRVERCRLLTPCGAPQEKSCAEMAFSYRESACQRDGSTVVSVTLALAPGEEEEIHAQMEEYFRRRKEKQPLEYPSAGSVFRRPAGHFAGALIEQCGLKGRRCGGAAVSEKHAGFIVNLGGASCADVLRLISLIQETVREQTGVSLECEVRRVGR